MGQGGPRASLKLFQANLSWLVLLSEISIREHSKYLPKFIIHKLKLNQKQLQEVKLEGWEESMEIFNFLSKLAGNDREGWRITRYHDLNFIIDVLLINLLKVCRSNFAICNTPSSAEILNRTAHHLQRQIVGGGKH